QPMKMEMFTRLCLRVVSVWFLGVGWSWLRIECMRFAKSIVELVCPRLKMRWAVRALMRVGSLLKHSSEQGGKFGA
ncbi:hypothetical protein U1Q18_043039, partial [Sarracenia purpurea var. burkii]